MGPPLGGVSLVHNTEARADLMRHKKGLLHPRQVSVLSGPSTQHVHCQLVQVFPTPHLRSGHPPSLFLPDPAPLCSLLWYPLNLLSLLLSHRRL